MVFFEHPEYASCILSLSVLAVGGVGGDQPHPNNCSYMICWLRKRLLLQTGMSEVLCLLCFACLHLMSKMHIL